MTAFGDELARLLAERGMSLRELARRSNYDNGHLSKVMRGRKRPTRELAERLNGILGGDGTLIELAGSGPLFNGAAGPETRDRIEWAAEHPRRADLAAVESLAAVLAGQRRAEDSLGSAAMLRPVIAQMGVIENLVREARGPVRPAMVHVGGQWAQFTGWLHTNVGQPDKGDARLSQALQWAVEAGEVNLLSEVLSFQGYAAWVTGRTGAVIGLSQAALRDRVAYPGQLAISAAQEAKGHAMEGRGYDTDRLLGEADTLAGAEYEHLDEAPPWLYYHWPGFYDVQRGIAYGYLAADRLYRDRAAEALTTGLAKLPGGAQSSEWGAEYLVHLAMVHARGGEVAEACAAALRAARIGRQTGSARLLGMLRRLRAGLAARWPDEPCVAGLADALR
jgi:transcriptional regulator with XRE-family HTH domain